ncbi:MAG: hypothetical protein ACOX7H_00780 [Bacillota bacterium]|jgi:hypothetical protein
MNETIDPQKIVAILLLKKSSLNDKKIATIQAKNLCNKGQKPKTLVITADDKYLSPYTAATYANHDWQKYYDLRNKGGLSL